METGRSCTGSEEDKDDADLVEGEKEGTEGLSGSGVLQLGIRAWRLRVDWDTRLLWFCRDDGEEDDETTTGTTAA